MERLPQGRSPLVAEAPVRKKTRCYAKRAQASSLPHWHFFGRRARVAVGIPNLPNIFSSRRRRFRWELFPLLPSTSPGSGNSLLPRRRFGRASAVIKLQSNARANKWRERTLVRQQSQFRYSPISRNRCGWEFPALHIWERGNSASHPPSRLSGHGRGRKKFGSLQAFGPAHSRPSWLARVTARESCHLNPQ